MSHYVLIRCTRCLPLRQKSRDKVIKMATQSRIISARINLFMCTLPNPNYYNSSPSARCVAHYTRLTCRAHPFIISSSRVDAQHVSLSLSLYISLSQRSPRNTPLGDVACVRIFLGSACVICAPTDVEYEQHRDWHVCHARAKPNPGVRTGV